MSGLTLAKRMQLSQQYERRFLTERYHQFRHVFPERRSELLEAAPERELALLTALFRDFQVRELVHPYPGMLIEHGAQVRQAVLDVQAQTQGDSGAGSATRSCRERHSEEAEAGGATWLTK
jgi:hypothetical protein